MCAFSNQQSFSHKIYKNDPILYRDYVGKSVVIDTEAKEMIQGIVYTVDPVSERVCPDGPDRAIITGYKPNFPISGYTATSDGKRSKNVDTQRMRYLSGYKPVYSEAMLSSFCCRVIGDYRVALLRGEDQTKLTLIFGHTIRSINLATNESQPTIEIRELFTNSPKKVDRSAIQERKNAIKKILKEFRFPMKEENDVLVIEDILRIEPPYEAQNCVCESSFILRRVQDLIFNLKT